MIIQTVHFKAALWCIPRYFSAYYLKTKNLFQDLQTDINYDTLTEKKKMICNYDRNNFCPLKAVLQVKLHKGG